MAQWYRCPQGHEWEISPSAAPPAQPLTCPVCGATITIRRPQPADSGATSKLDTITESDLPVQVPPTDPAPSSDNGRPAPDSGAARPAAEVPGYEILGELGRGGMGVVYKARQVTLNRVVALKMVLAGAHAGSEGLSRFRIEAEAVARLQHPNIVQIYEVNQHAGLPYFSMEFVDGGSLEQKAGDKPQPPRWSAEVVERLARAMHAAHQRGILHRDLKPANVLLTGDGQPKITDFGLAKQLDSVAQPTQTGEVMGTPSYMSPEQAEGRRKDLGPHTDVYALGAILYDLLTGRPPFQGETPVDTLLQVLHEEPVPPIRLQSRLPADLNTLCLKCLEKTPNQRYASAEALADDLRRYLNQEPIQARPVSSWERAVKWTRRRPAVAALLGLSGLLVLGLFGLSVYANVELNAAAQRERHKAREADEQRAIAQQNALQAENNAEDARTQEREAQGQRRQAEANLRKAREAVDQMLTVVGKDLLEDVPGFDQKRTELLSKAVEFYQGFLRKRTQDAGLRRETGQIYFSLGNLFRGLRQYDQAEQAYTQAIDLQTQLVNQFPSDPRYPRELANSYNYLGETLRTQGVRLEEAERAYDAALELQQKRSGDALHRQHLARTFYNRGILRMDTGRRTDAREDFDAALRCLDNTKGGSSGADDQQTRARTYLNRGILLKDTGHPAEAELDYGEAIRLLTRLHKEHPARSDYRHELAVSHINRGNLLHRQKRRAEAEADLRTALPLLQRLREDFAERPTYAAELANGLNSLAAVRWAAGDAAEARSGCEQALALYRRLATDFPDVPDHHSALAGSLDNLALLLRDHKPPQLDEARQLLEEAERHHQRAMKANPRHRTYCQRLRSHYTVLAEVLLRQKEHQPAAGAAEQLVQVFPDDWQRYQLAAEVLARCMLQVEGTPRAQEYADRAVTMLKQAIERGLGDTRLWATPALKALRERRKDCDRMLSDLEKRAKSPADG